LSLLWNIQKFKRKKYNSETKKIIILNIRIFISILLYYQPQGIFEVLNPEAVSLKALLFFEFS
tara:strand:+ start:26 stop:214 length:189 start_codon:yes stop_codon:yes gene_type:complete